MARDEYVTTALSSGERVRVEIASRVTGTTRSKFVRDAALELAERVLSRLAPREEPTQRKGRS